MAKRSKNKTRKMNQDEWEKLRRFGLFTHLSEEQLRQLAQEVIILDLDIDEIVFSEDSLIRSMYFIDTGAVQVLKNNVPLASLKAGEYFGEMSILKGEKRTATVKTLEPSLLYELPEELFIRLIKSSPEAMNDLLLTYDQRLRKENRRVIDQFLELKKQYNELQETHKQLLQSEKLASIGMVTSGIAHEINNPLAVIIGYLEIFKSKFQADELDQDFIGKSLDRFEKSTKAIEKIIVGLKSYVRADDGVDFEIQVNEAIQGSIDLVSYLYSKEQIVIETQFTNERLKIMGNYGKLQQIIINLISNARDALEERPTKVITIITGKKDNWTEIRVSDTGQGIPSHLHTKIFEKFFTTKPVGKGTGLGLDIISTIVGQMQGKITVESKENEGTTFVILLPTVEGAN